MPPPVYKPIQFLISIQVQRLGVEWRNREKENDKEYLSEANFSLTQLRFRVLFCQEKKYSLLPM